MSASPALSGAPGCPSCGGTGQVRPWYPTDAWTGPWPCDNCKPGGWMDQKGLPRDYYVARTHADPRIVSVRDVSRSPHLQVQELELTEEARRSLGVRSLHEEEHPTLVPAPVRQPRQVGAWHQRADGRWSHRPRCMVVINAVLRALQPWPRKLVIYTDCDGGDAEQPPRVLGYGLGFVQHLPEPPPDTDGDGP